MAASSHLVILPEEDVGERVGIELQVFDTGQVVGENDRAEHRRDVKHLGAGTGGLGGGESLRPS